MNNIEKLKSARDAFLESTDRYYGYPAGGRNEILTPSERVLLSTLDSEAISKAEIIGTLSEGLSAYACDGVVIFGARLAILAVRKSQPHLFQLAVLPLVAGGSKIDWRDVLSVFAVFEDCAARLKVDFQAELESIVQFADEPKLRPIMDGFFCRSHEMRMVEVMGFRATGSGEEFSFARV